MLDPTTSPEVSHEDQDEEQLDIGDVEPDDMVDEEGDGDGDVEGDGDGDVEGDVDEEDKPDGQEGLDLDMAEEDGVGFQDEPDGEHETGASNGDHEIINEEGDDSTKVENIEEVETKEDLAQEEEKGEREEHDVEDAEHLLSHPPHGSEVFVGGITKDTAEDDLRELCAPCGEIFEVRLLKDKDTGENKGYAFVTFTNKENAEKAIETLNDTELKGKKLRFSQSQSKHRIFIGNVPKNWDREELEKALADKGPGIESIELLKDPQNPSRNRGFAFVEYYNHACADNARKNMLRPSFKLGTNTPTISWADPRGTDSATSQVKVIYVRNLPDTVTEEQLQQLFECHGEITKVVLPASKPGQPKRDFGFIHFSDRSSALKAIEKTEKYELEGRVLETSLAKPPAEKRSFGFDSSYRTQRSGLLSHYQSRGGYGYGGSDMYGSLGSAYGSNRGYTQPLIYGRGPPPAGMTMVPMMLPDGRIGYVLQQQGSQGGSAPYRTGRSGHGSRSGSGSSSERSSSNRRYRPY